MRSYGIHFSLADVRDDIANETYNTVFSYNKGVREGSPELAKNIADLTTAYPTIPKQILPYVALSGLSDSDELALQLANRAADKIAKSNTQNLVTDVNFLKRGVQLGFLALDATFQNVSRGFKSSVVAAQQTGRNPIGVAAAATLGGLGEMFIPQKPGKEGQTTANFLNSVYGGGVGDKFKQARDAYGPNEFRLALKEIKEGNPVNLGTGFLPKSLNLKQSQTYLDDIRAGKTEREALQRAADTYGVPITQVYDIREDRNKYTAPSGKKVNISPGRVAAVQMLEPGTTGYSVVSGIIDGVFRVAADPTNLALMYGAGVKTAMRTMVTASERAARDTAGITQFMKTFALGKTGKEARLLYYGRTIDDMRATKWGQDFGQAIAKLEGPAGRAFLYDIKEFDAMPSAFKEMLLAVDDPIQVWDIFEMFAKGGDLTGKHLDDIFNIVKSKVPPGYKRQIDEIRRLSENNANFGLSAFPARPTTTGELINQVAKIITKSDISPIDFAPLRKLAGALLAKDDPARGLLGMGASLGRNRFFPRHIKRSLQLRPETLMLISDLDNAAINADRMLKLVFADAETRGTYIKDVIDSTTQAQLNEVVYAINIAIAEGIQKQNPLLAVDVEDIIKQQEAYTAQIESVRDYFGNSNGALSFNGVKIKKKIEKLVKDLQGHFEATGVKLNPKDAERYIFEAVPSMHLLTQASKDFTAQLLDPRDVVQATKAHQLLIGPDDSYLNAWIRQKKGIFDKDNPTTIFDAFKIPRKAVDANMSRTGRLTLKPPTIMDALLEDLQNKFLKPMWMFRMALALRIAPEEAIRAAFGGKINIFTGAMKRMSMTSNKSLGFLGEKVREDQVFQLYNNVQEVVATLPLGPNDVEFLKQILDVDTLKNFQVLEYDAIEQLMKSHLLETNIDGQISDYIIAAAINGVDLKNFVKGGVQESKLSLKSRSIQSTAKGKIVGYDQNVHESMGAAFINGGGFSTDLNKQSFLDLGTRKPSDADVFVSPYKSKEFPLGKRADLEKEAAEKNMTLIELIDAKIDNLFFDDETIRLLSLNDHCVGTYIDSELNLMLDVSIGLRGENAIDNAAFLGINGFQESIYIANKELATQTGWNDLLTSDGTMYLYRKLAKDGKIVDGAAAIDYNSTIAKEVLQKLYKSNFDALSLKITDVQGAGRGMPSGTLMSNDDTYNRSLGENAIMQGIFEKRKDLAQNLFLRVDKRLANGKINPQYWEGIWTELGELLAPDPIAVRLVNLGLEETMNFLRNTKKGQNIIRDFVERSFNPEDIKYLTDDKALKEYLESVQYRIGKAVGNPTAKILDPYTGKELDISQTGRAWWRNKQLVYPKYVVDLSVTENNKLQQFIKNGGFMDGKDWVAYKNHINTINIKRRGEANQQFFEEFIEMMKNEIDLKDLGPTTIARQFDLQNRVSDAGTIITGEEIRAAGYTDDFQLGSLDRVNPLLDTVYDTLISKPSNWLNRDPLFRYTFYETAIDLIKFMDEKTAAEFVKGAKVWIEGTKLWDNLLEAAKLPKLENTVTSLTQAETILKTKAMQDVKALFYSTSDRHIASDLFSKYVPFPEIWAEVFKTWGSLIADHPQKFNMARITIDNGTEAKPWDSENGFLSTDPRTGKLMFNYADVFNVLTLGTFKGLGKVLEATGVRDTLPDALTAPYQTTVFGQNLTDKGVRATAPGFAAGLNLVAQNGFAPGFGPVVQLPMKFFISKFGSTKAFRKFFLGEYESSGKFTDIAQPAWLKKFRLFLTGDDTSNTELYRQYASTVMDLYAAYVIAGIVKQDNQQSIEKGYAMAAEQAKALFGFRAAAQFALPTAVQPRIEVEDKNGQWWGIQTLVNKYQEMLIRNGYDHYKTQTEFLEKFGVNPIPLKQPGSYRIGKQPIKENSFMFWEREENNYLLDKINLPNTAYYIYPDKIEDELFYPAYYETKAQNITADEYADFMRRTQAIFEYEKGKEDIRNNGKTKSEQDAELSQLRKDIQEDYGIDMFNFQGKPQTVSTEEIFFELDKWKDYEQTANSPEFVYVKKYTDLRNELLDVILKGGEFEYKGNVLTVEENNGKIYYTYDEKDAVTGLTKKVRRMSSKTSRNLNGTSQVMIDARKIMFLIWQDLYEEGIETNFPQLANEVLFYEISPTNSANEK